MKEGKQKVIHINFFPAEVDDVYFTQLNIVGDIAHSIQHLTELEDPVKNWDFSYFMRVKAEVDNHLSKYFEDTRFPNLPQRLVNNIRKTLAEEYIVRLDNGVYKYGLREIMHIINQIPYFLIMHLQQWELDFHLAWLRNLFIPTKKLFPHAATVVLR